jgi:hypothetical protein
MSKETFFIVPRIPMILLNELVRGSRKLGAPLTMLSLVLGLTVAPAKAQTSIAGTVSGQVTDESGAAVPGSDIRLVETATGQAFATVSNDAGRYTFPTVPPGSMTLPSPRRDLPHSTSRARK